MNASDRGTLLPEAGRARVFCINGSIELLGIMREILSDEGYDVTVLGFVPGIYERIEAAQPALVMIDLVFQEPYGWRLLEDLWASPATHDIPVIVTSTDQKLLDEARGAPERFGERNYLAKPFDLDELLTLVASLARRA